MSMSGRSLIYGPRMLPGTLQFLRGACVDLPPWLEHARASGLVVRKRLTPHQQTIKAWYSSKWHLGKLSELVHVEPEPKCHVVSQVSAAPGDDHDLSRILVGFTAEPFRPRHSSLPVQQVRTVCMEDVVEDLGCQRWRSLMRERVQTCFNAVMVGVVVLIQNVTKLECLVSADGRTGYSVESRAA